METQFWIERWDQGQIGFHLDAVHSGLKRYWPEISLPEGAGVLVPLCGKSLDLAYLQGLGHPVTGIELSALAIADFFKSQGIRPVTSTDRDFMRHCGGGFSLLEGDFFKITASNIGAMGAVYDRAALIAMPPSMQGNYARHLKELAGKAPILLITLEYPQPEMQGPPFSVTEQTLTALFSDTHQIDLLERHDALEENESLSRRGLTCLHECVWRLLPKSQLASAGTSPSSKEGASASSRL